MKTLITAQNIDQFIATGNSCLYVDPASTIITPGAKDELAKRHIEIVYGPENATAKPEQSAGAIGCATKNTGGDFINAGNSLHRNNVKQLEAFMFSIAAALKAEYGINDPEQLKNMTMQVIKTLKETI